MLLLPYKIFSFVNTRVEDRVKFGPRETEANFLLKDVYIIFLAYANCYK